jgi:ADP-heptose:LPS heptosyltransferase
MTVKKNQILFGDRILNKQIIKKIKNLAPETIVDLTGSITSALVIFRTKVPNIIGINEDFYRGLYSKYIPIRKTPHLLDIYLDVVRSIAPDLVEDSVREFSIQIKREKQILIHPFAGWAAKEWSFNKFLLLYEKLIKEFECKFIFEKNILKFDLIYELQKMDIKYIETKTIEELKYELLNSSLLISNDSGPIHIASMLGVPTFGIYGPTHPAYHVPIGKYHRYVMKKINCSPQSSKYCFTYGGRFCPTYDCMNSLTLDEVSRTLDNFINELGILQKKYTLN